MDWEAISSEVLDAASSASGKILRIYHGYDDYKVQMKSDATPLTIADEASNEILNAALRNIMPGTPVVSEENRSISYRERMSYPSFWLVDPLDGTKEFIKRNGEFSINIAFVEDRQPVFGLVFLPVLDMAYLAVRDQGAFKIEQNKKIALQSARITSTSSLRVACSRSHINPRTKNYLARFEKPNLLPAGSALKFLLIAEGKADLYPRLGPTMEWDSAAGHVILHEAGGRVVNIETGEELTYNKRSLYNPEFLAIGRTDKLDDFLLREN